MTTERIKRLQEALESLSVAQAVLTDIELALPDNYNLFFGWYSPATEDAEKCLATLEHRIQDELEKLEAEVSA